jgi:hypothetical protein
MKYSTLLLAAVFFCLNASAASVDGVYERVSLANVETGFSPEKGNRKGLLQMANGYYSMMTMNADRRVLGPDEKIEDMADGDQIAYLQEWLDVNAHSGRYEVDGDTLVWYRDISENPKEVGTVSRLQFERRDDLLIISFTLRNGDKYEWIWRQIRS